MCQGGGGAVKIFSVGGNVDQRKDFEKMRQGVGGNDNVSDQWL